MWTLSIEVKLVSFSAVTHSAVAASAVLVPPPVSLHVYFEVFDQTIYAQSAAISVVVSIRAFQSLDLLRGFVKSHFFLDVFFILFLSFFWKP